MPTTTEVPVNTLRIISSVFEPDAVRSGDLTRDQADTLARAIDAQLPYAARESYTCDEIGQKIYHVALVSYDTDGGTRWAVYTSDLNNGSCHLDSADREAADTRYEDEVRQLADCADPGTPWWDVTDVDGVPDRSDIEDETDGDDDL